MSAWATFRRVPMLLKAGAPGWTIAEIVATVCEVALSLASLYLVKRLVDSVTASLSGSSGNLDTVLRVVLLTGVITLIHAAVRSFAGYARQAQGLLVGDYVDGLIQKRATEVDLAFYESPRYFDTLQRARQAGRQRPARVVANILQLGKNALMLVAAVGLIASVNTLVIPVLAIAVVPALLLRLYFSRSAFALAQRRTQLERQAGHLDWLMTSDYHAKELRLNQLGEHLRGKHSSLRTKIRTEQLGISKQRTIFEGVAAAGAAAAFFGVLAYLARETAAGRSTVGDLVLFFVVFQRVQAIGQELVGEVARMYEDNLYLQLLFRFLDTRPILSVVGTPVAVPQQMRLGIRFEGVSFRYPGSDAWALRDINLELKPGQVVALVGANGSGKTSLIKLLCRLYDPTEGRVTLDGIDVRQFDPEAYRRVCSVLFQDFSRYSETVTENIRFGDIALPPDSPRIGQAGRASGADVFVSELPNGYNTRLTRLFDDGRDLSTGQWQKLALARAFIRSSQLVVLDEPTSALDPEAEFELFEDFRTRIESRMALVISHRLSTVRLANRIYVLHDGRITEAGTHEELMNQQGRYAGMFSKQGKYFRERDSGTHR